MSIWVCYDCEYRDTRSTLCNDCTQRNDYYWKKTKKCADIMKKEDEIKTGNISDGYHTFNELYHHRAILFSVICNQNKEIAWKSKKHDDGTMFDNMFIVGIETPHGQATYHYDIEPYWDIFNVKTLDFAPTWDGHTSEQAIERIKLLTT